MGDWPLSDPISRVLSYSVWYPMLANRWGDQGKRQDSSV
jgi:hypothetical protein